MGHKKKSKDKAMVKMALVIALVELAAAVIELIGKLLDR